MGFTELLTVVFILLKVFGVISWSWWLVWLPEIIAGVVYLGILIFWLIAYLKIKKEVKQIESRSEFLKNQRKEMMDKHDFWRD